MKGNLDFNLCLFCSKVHCFCFFNNWWIRCQVTKLLYVHKGTGESVKKSALAALPNENHIIADYYNVAQASFFFFFFYPQQPSFAQPPTAEQLLSARRLAAERLWLTERPNDRLTASYVNIQLCTNHKKAWRDQHIFGKQLFHSPVWKLLANTNTGNEGSYKICQQRLQELQAKWSSYHPEKKEKTASSCQNPVVACHCAVYGVVHYVISYYRIQNSQINPSPGSSKQPDSLSLMAVKESRGDMWHCSKSSVSIFWGASSSCSPDNDAFISHWDSRHVPYTKISRDLSSRSLPLTLSLSPSLQNDLVAFWVSLFACLSSPHLTLPASLRPSIRKYIMKRKQINV